MDRYSRQSADQHTLRGAQNTPLNRSSEKASILSRLEIIFLAVLIVVTFSAHAINLRHSPTLGRLNDEGIYTQQAWSVLNMGRLSPYTYWYDHAPAGWILLAGWMGLTGGSNTFGAAVDSGRVLILLLNTSSVVLLYFLGRKLDLSIFLAGLGAFLYGFSPLALSFGRLVLLDNIMIFWLLVSLNLLLAKEVRTVRVFLSGLTFGLAVLTKEPAVFFLPVMLYIGYRLGKQNREPVTLIAWLAPMVFVVMLYPLYALFRGELASIPIANSPFDSHSGVYLIDTLRWQTSRSDEGLGFVQNLIRNWIPGDPIVMILGLLATLANLVIGWRSRHHLLGSLFSLLPLIYMARGGLVFDFYILFALPFLSLNLVLLMDWSIKRFRGQSYSALLAGGTAVLFLLVNLTTGQLSKVYSAALDQPYREALAWMQENIEPYSMMVIPDNYWVDLHDPGEGEKAFPNAHSYWKVGTDPAIRDELIKNDHQNINYVVLFPGMREEIQNGNHTVTIEALNNATLVQRFEQPGSFVEIWRVNDSIIPTGPVNIPRTSETSNGGRSPVYQTLVNDSYTYMQVNFSQDGRYTTVDGSVSSESQAYAMLRAVWMDDRDEFQRVWEWTRANLINPNGLLAWRWKDGAVIDTSSNAGADTQAALALVLAGRRWGDPELIEAGTALVQSIRNTEVVILVERPYLAGGDWAVGDDPLAVNPSYFAPFAYRIFSEIDPDGGWLELLDNGYQLVMDASNLSFSGETPVGLPPDWLGVQRDTGQLVRLELPGGDDTTRYGYIAPRTFWQIALDYSVSQDGRAQGILNQANIIADQVSQRGFPGSVFNHDGTLLVEEATPVANAGALGILMARDPEAAERFFRDQFVNNAQHPQNGMAAWGDPSDLSNQEWAWFAAALYNNNLLYFEDLQ